MFKELGEVDITHGDRFEIRSDRVAILALVNSAEDLSLLRSLEERMSKKFQMVEGIYFTHNKQLYDEGLITPKMLNWFGKPTDDFLTQFIDIEFDQLWVVSSTVTLTMEYLIARIKSRLKLAPYLNETYKDCHIFTHSKDKELKHVIFQLEDIMLKLNKHG